MLTDLWLDHSKRFHNPYMWPFPPLKNLPPGKKIPTFFLTKITYHPKKNSHFFLFTKKFWNFFVDRIFFWGGRFFWSKKFSDFFLEMIACMDCGNVLNGLVINLSTFSIQMCIIICVCKSTRKKKKIHEPPKKCPHTKSQFSTEHSVVSTILRPC